MVTSGCNVPTIDGEEEDVVEVEEVGDVMTTFVLARPDRFFPWPKLKFWGSLMELNLEARALIWKSMLSCSLMSLGTHGSPCWVVGFLFFFLVDLVLDNDDAWDWPTTKRSSSPCFSFGNRCFVIKCCRLLWCEENFLKQSSTKHSYFLYNYNRLLEQWIWAIANKWNAAWRLISGAPPSPSFSVPLSNRLPFSAVQTRLGRRNHATLGYECGAGVAMTGFAYIHGTQADAAFAHGIQARILRETGHASKQVSRGTWVGEGSEWDGVPTTKKR